MTEREAPPVEQDIDLESHFRERLGKAPPPPPIEIDWQRVISEAHVLCRTEELDTEDALTRALAREKRLVRQANLWRGAA